MFKREKSKDFYTKIRSHLWPEKGLLRNFLYLWKRLFRIPDSTYSVSMGFALGVFISFTPFFGLHLIISVVTSWFLKINIFSSIIGNLFGSIISYPLMAIGMLTISNENTSREWLHIIVNFIKTTIPIFSGILIIGFILSIVCYFLIKYIIEIFKKNRPNRGK